MDGGTGGSGSGSAARGEAKEIACERRAVTDARTSNAEELAQAQVDGALESIEADAARAAGRDGGGLACRIRLEELSVTAAARMCHAAALDGPARQLVGRSHIGRAAANLRMEGRERQRARSGRSGRAHVRGGTRVETAIVENKLTKQKECFKCAISSTAFLTSSFGSF